MFFIKAEDAGILAYFKDDNEDKGKKDFAEASLYARLMLKKRLFYKNVKQPFLYMFLFVHAAGGGLFYQAAVVLDRVIEAVASGKVIAVKALGGKDAAGNIAAQTALAVDVNGLSRFKLAEALS